MSTTTRQNLKYAKRAVLDALFPIFCLSCRTEGAWLCEKCFAELKILDFQVCPACEENITDKGFLCQNCRDSRISPLDGLIAAVSYEDPAVKKLVHNFKYRFVGDISRLLSKLLVKALVRNDFPLPDLIAFVPLHPKRLRWRGFNQSFLLAAHISKELAPLLNIDILDILERKKYNQPQMNVKNYKERLQNVCNIFGLKPEVDPSLVKNKTFLLVDDIATTGATLQECAKILKQAGAKKIYAAVIARQSLKK
ncbi:MAG TPA: ComF family protein [Candidatus Bathyarchaeia archaeon]|nr:ComF family protein [Candidatus Bathyarchaeia archaeon]